MTRMPAPDVPVSVIFDALEDAVAASSQGEIARQVGLTSSGLKRLMQKRSIRYVATEAKLRRWYLRHGAAVGPDERAVRAALDVLLSGMPREKRKSARRAILKAVERGHGEKPPEWLEALLKG